jgi:hypothetical protein
MNTVETAEHYKPNSIGDHTQTRSKENHYPTAAQKQPRRSTKPKPKYKQQQHNLMQINQITKHKQQNAIQKETSWRRQRTTDNDTT